MQVLLDFFRKFKTQDLSPFFENRRNSQVFLSGFFFKGYIDYFPAPGCSMVFFSFLGEPKAFSRFLLGFSRTPKDFEGYFNCAKSSKHLANSRNAGNSTAYHIHNLHFIAK